MRRECRKNDLAGRAVFRVTQHLLAVLVLIVLTGPQASAQGPQTYRGGGGDAIGVERVRQLREDVDLWPLIVHPKNAAEMEADETLVQLNGKLAKTVRDCLSGEFAWSKDKFTSGDFVRTIKITMLGPRFLSMVATDGFYCGGAHPEDDLTALVFDMETGKQVDWNALVAKSSRASSPKNPPGDGEGTRPLMLPELQVIYAAAEETYCKDYFEDEQAFVIWPDAESGTLIAKVAGLPHVAAPCKNEFKLTIEQARKLGFDESLLLAIEEAHRIAGSTAKPVRNKPVPTATTRPN
jgi:hypothetical protein